MRKRLMRMVMMVMMRRRVKEVSVALAIQPKKATTSKKRDRT